LTAVSSLIRPRDLSNDAIWVDLSMNFIEGLPNSSGKDMNFEMMDRLSKYAYFLALSDPFSVATVAQLYSEHIFKLHGFPENHS